MSSSRQLPIPGVKPAANRQRPITVVDWIASVRSEVVDVLRAARSALNAAGPNKHAATIRRITALLERIEGTTS